MGTATSRLWGSGEPSREFLYVDDAARGLILCAENLDVSDPVNLGVGRETKIRDLAATISNAAGFEGETVWDASMPDGQMKRGLDVSGRGNWPAFRRRSPRARHRADGALVRGEGVAAGREFNRLRVEPRADDSPSCRQGRCGRPQLEQRRNDAAMRRYRAQAGGLRRRGRQLLAALRVVEIDREREQDSSRRSHSWRAWLRVNLLRRARRDARAACSRGAAKPRRSSNGRRKRAPRGKREEQLLSSITAHPDFRGRSDRVRSVNTAALPDPQPPARARSDHQEGR